MHVPIAFSECLADRTGTTEFYKFYERVLGDLDIPTTARRLVVVGLRRLRRGDLLLWYAHFKYLDC